MVTVPGLCCLSQALRNRVDLRMPAFRARLGVSVRQEIAKVRIDEAKRLLEKTTLPLAEVCSLSGFSSKAYFTAAFNEATGTTPLEWRITKSRHS